MTLGAPVDVVVPTRNRPEKLALCLDALAGARSQIAFRVYVVDSSDFGSKFDAVVELCARYSFVTLHRHSRLGLAAARNECTRAGDAPLLISVDDDVYVEADAITRLVARYGAESGWRVVAGQVFWGAAGSAAVRMRPIGYGTRETDDRKADFFVTALIMYPRVLARVAPFNERIASSDDRFVGALWRRKGVRQIWEPRAVARHDDEHNAGLRAVAHQESHIYANLFDAIMVRRSLGWACAFELLGFAAGAKKFVRQREAGAFVRAWARGNLRFARDRRWLTEMVRQPLPAGPPEPEWSFGNHLGTSEPGACQQPARSRPGQRTDR